MFAIRLIFFPLFLSLTACVGSTPPSQFYLLEPITDSAADTRAMAETPLIALGPVRIPHYLNRPQIVRASAKNAYQLSEFNRWAESLDGNISRVLSQNLGLLVPADVVMVNNSNRAAQAQLRVAVNILEFHVNPQGQAGLTAVWQLMRGEDIVLNKQVSYHASASTTDYALMVQALNDCLNRMSRELAESLQVLLKK